MDSVWVDTGWIVGFAVYPVYDYARNWIAQRYETKSSGENVEYGG